MLRIIFVISAFFAFTAQAQNKAQQEEKKCNYYKWVEKGGVHYGRAVPHNIDESKTTCFYAVPVSGYQVEIKPEDLQNLSSYTIISSRAHRPESHSEGQEALPNGAESEAQPVAGTITKSERCRIAKNEIKLLKEKKTVFEEDANGNLIPLSSEQIAQRLENAQAEAALCEQE